jgi:hypothetical protein
MKSVYALPLALSASLALLGACSKPAETPAAVADSASEPAPPAAVTAPGGAVSPPAANGAVNADANTSSTNVAAASNSFTESEARGHIEHAGYSDVTGLAKTSDGLWIGQAKKGGKTVNVAVDFKGAVTSQ